jgi:SAM-dependent methyltransferase
MDQTKIWDYFQNNEEGLRAFQMALPRYRFLAARISSASAVLNIGVGAGGLESILVGRDIRVSCLDPSESAITNLRKSLSIPADRARVGFSQNVPFDSSSFDVVVMSEVLEHLDDDILITTLSEVRRVLRNGGIFMGTVPADEDLLANQVVCPDCGKLFHRWGHVQSFGALRLHTMLASTFGQADVIRTIFGMGQYLNWKGKISWLVKTVLVAMGIKGTGEAYFFQARKQ